MRPFEQKGSHFRCLCGSFQRLLAGTCGRFPNGKMDALFPNHVAGNVCLNGLVLTRRRRTTETGLNEVDGTIGISLTRQTERQQKPCALLGICKRTVLAALPVASPYRRLWRKVPENPKTLGEHLRKARINRKMTNVQVAHILEVAYQTVEKWEHNRRHTQQVTDVRFRAGNL